ncbi:hypothetical protein [Legionella drancourtii]|uniref:DUF4153 domain-containing protein n=1 Tax=Legionella drancourtii LLAP12 TaxID=658187 RepID=G9EQ51_9GAMM|nr:hypothetical protein [Legionella drancourtii]EHL30626.1 hypothetical protein LDG_7397 [Legionella drancourtii LLAP12]
MTSKKGIYLFTLLGLFLGFTLDLLYRNENGTVFYYALTSLFCLLYALTYDNKQPIRLVASSFIVALFLSLPLLPIKVDFNPTNPEHLILFVSAFPIFTYAAHCFHYAYHHDNTWHVNYSSLFAAVWNTIPLLFIGSLFATLANLLILLAAFIFKTVGSDYLWTLYIDNMHFRLISNVTLFFIGLGIGQQNINIINSLRFLLLRIMYYLFPFLALISMVYFILYLIHSPASNEEHINPLFILIALVSLGILFFNAYYQDGSVETETHPPYWLSLSLKIYRVVLLLLSLMMVYRVFREYFLDINIVIYEVAIILYSLIYAITAWFSKDKEREGIQKGNIGTALFFIIVLFLVNLPYMPLAFKVGTKVDNTAVVTTQAN